MGKRWRIQAHDADRILALERGAGISPIVAQLLVSRGITDLKQVQSFLDPKLTGLRDPEDLPGVTDAANLIHAAISAKRKIVVYGDYDADGMTGASILLGCLQMLGATVRTYVPNRLEEGYGLNDQALMTLAAEGTQMVISVDCGIASVREAETAKQHGIELIVTDHHQFGETLPAAAALVHPALPGTTYPFAGLCGAGVAFKLAWALCCRASDSKKVSPRMRSFLLTAIGLAAIGTVADVVPLIDENRILVRHGLKSLRQSPPIGVRALMRVAKLDAKPTLSSEDIAFSLAPRLNAAGRLGQAQLGIELLTTDSESRARDLADFLTELNGRRDTLERSVYLAANKQIKERFDSGENSAFVLAGSGWHAGVIGIVAGRLAEKYHRPVVLIALDELGTKPGSGSGRSACGLDLHSAFARCDEHLVSHGGHAAAAGLKIDEGRVDAFRTAFCDYAADAISAEDRIAEVRIDAEAAFSQLTLQTVQQIEQMAPFGQGNPRPTLSATLVTKASPPRYLGSGERHLSVELTQHGVKIRAVAFGKGDWLQDLTATEGTIDIAYRPVINEFRGRRTVEMHLVDWRPTAEAKMEPAP
jgi:single-stranded-DNA-specific exonuclease